ncbi:Uncharacterised protein [Vibrio cholerae]|nr:Uncharacterised protein [Vibrio cholerae]
MSGFTTHANTTIQRQIVTDHRYLLHGFNTRTNQSCAFDWTGDFAIFNQVSFRGREHKLTGGDIDLTATKVRRVNAFFHRSDDLFWCVLAR